MADAITFIINDETKLNSYGFRTVNDGIDLVRFEANPVCLDAHWGSNQRVIGRWINIRVEGSLLKADLEFDEEDENAKALMGKVQRGFLKGSSMGLNPDRESFEIEPSGTWALFKSELMEVSLVAIPSNANAVRLYANTGEPMSLETVNLSLPNWLNESKNTENDMKEIKLSIAALVVLGLDKSSQVTNDDISPAVEKLTSKYTDLKAKYTALLDAGKERLKLSATTVVDTAIKDGRLDTSARESWINMGVSDFDAMSKAIASIPTKVSLSSSVLNPSDPNKPITQEAFYELSVEEQLKFKNENAQEYTKLFA